MSFVFFRHSSKNSKKLLLISPELIQERLVQIIFRIPESVEMKQCSGLTIFRDFSEKACNGDSIPIISSHEFPALRLKEFLHPVSRLHYGTMKMMRPFPTVQIAIIPRLTRIHHKRIEPAGQWLCCLHRTTVIVQKDAGIIFTDGFEKVDKIAAVIKQRRNCELIDELINTANVQAQISKMFR